MTLLPRFVLLLLSLSVFGWAGTASAQHRRSVTILVSIDGMRADYLDRGVTPALSRLAAGGVRAAMRPSFPSKTFPNHYTLITGLVPDRNGIVGNKMRDPAKPDFTFTMDKSDDHFWWDEAEPIWAAAERAGIRTGAMFWPGTNAGYHKTRPSDWWHFDAANTETQRVDEVLDWLARRQPARRPRFVMLYFDKVDHEGHKHGPDSAEVNQALRVTDAAIARLVAGLKALGQPANLVVVADHGMAATPPAQIIPFDRLADPTDADVIEEGPYVAIDVKPGHEAALAAALARPHDHVRCSPREQLPARLHYGHNPREPAWVCLVDVGWTVASKVSKTPDLGTHGYDNAAPEMRAIFIANGPAFRAGKTLPVFDNVDVEPLLRDLVGLPAHQVDGTDAVFRGVLRR